MSECVVRMEMPRVCITENGYYGYCPMDRVWCIQRNAPPDIAMREAYEAMTEKIPSWCPILCQLPEGHGRLVREKDVRWAIDDIVIEIAERIGHVPMTKNETMEYVNHLPTIIPAERSET